MASRVAVGGWLGVSASRSQDMYGVNSVVYRVVVRGEECALKAIITAYGPFAARDGAALEQAVRDELQQPPHSPHLLRYYSHSNGIVEGDVAREWPRDVQTTPVGSLTKFLLMPLCPTATSRRISGPTLCARKPRSLPWCSSCSRA